MPDERQQSIREGIGVPPESEIGRKAEDRNRDRLNGIVVDDSDYGKAINERADRRETPRE